MAVNSQNRRFRLFVSVAAARRPLFESGIGWALPRIVFSDYERRQHSAARFFDERVLFSRARNRTARRGDFQYSAV